MKQTDLEILTNQIKEKYGEIVGGQDLIKLLGYKTTASFSQACSRGQLPIDTFIIKHRRGRFAFCQDVANWILSLKHNTQTDRSE